MNNTFLSGGKHYDLLINWEKRLEYEIPFLVEVLFQDPRIKNVLEVGCGTGQHIKALSHLNVQITGIDIDKSMIEQAKENNPNSIDIDKSMIEQAKENNPNKQFICQDFMSFQSDKKYDAIYSLGNSIGLIASKNSYEEIIKKFSELLIPTGLFVFQLLNTEKDRNNWSAPRAIRKSEGEYIFLRGFTTTQNHIHPEILTLFRESGKSEWILNSTGKSSIPRISSKGMSTLLEQNSFKVLKIFGDYRKNNFSNTNSQDMIFFTGKIAYR